VPGVRHTGGEKTASHDAQRRKYCGGLAAAAGSRATLASSYSISDKIRMGIIRRRAAACGRTSPAKPLFGSQQLQLWGQICRWCTWANVVPYKGSVGKMMVIYEVGKCNLTSNMASYKLYWSQSCTRFQSGLITLSLQSLLLHML